MIKTNITNMLKISSGDIQLEEGKVTFVTGMNATGKTSVATLTAALLAGQQNPAGSKSKSKAYLQDEAESGNAEVICDDEPLSRWDAVSGEMSIFESKFKRPSEASVGLVDFCGQMSQPARVALWEEYFLPSDEVIQGHIAKQLMPHLNEQQLEGVMETIQEDDLEVVNKTYQARARDEKALWMNLTGETWGKAKAVDWLPPGWSADFDGMTIKQLEERIGHFKEELRSLHVADAISLADIERGKEAQAEWEAANKKLEEMRQQVRLMIAELAKPEGAYQRQVEIADKANRDLREWDRQKPVKSNFLNCPECGSALTLKNGLLFSHNRDEANESRREWEAEMERLTTERDIEIQKKEELFRELAPQRQAKDKLIEEGKRLSAQCETLKRQAEMANATPTEDNSKNIDLCEQELEEASNWKRMVVLRKQARQHHENIIQYQLISSILGPKGVRATCMAENMVKFDNLLNIISSATGWPRIEIDKSYAISIDGRSFLRLCAESERLRAQYTLQIAIARYRRDKVVILDCADHLDDANQFALADLLKYVSEQEAPPAIMVCGTELDVHQLNSNGFNYRIVNGKTTLID